MDEHIVLCSGDSIGLKSDSLHYDYKDMTVWIDKHNKYSSRKVLNYFDSLNEKVDISGMSKGAKLKSNIFIIFLLEQGYIFIIDITGTRAFWQEKKVRCLHS